MATPPDEDELAVKARLHALLGGPSTPAAQPMADAGDTASAAATAQPQPDTARRDALDTDTCAAAMDNAETPAAAAQPEDRRRIQPWRSGRYTDLTPDDEDEPDADAPDADADESSADDEDEGGAAAQPPNSPAAQPKKRLPRLRSPSTPRSYTAGPASGSGALVSAPAPRMSLIEAVQTVPPRFRWLGVHLSAAVPGYMLGWVQWSTRTSAWIHAHGWLNQAGGFYVGLAIGCELLRRKAYGQALVIRWLAAVPISSLVIGAALYGNNWQHLNLEFHL
ncbi:hypothetical protein [Streptomyces sp. YIM S03343]